MKSRRRSGSITEKNLCKTPPSPRPQDVEQIKMKTSREKHRNSYIPVLRGEKIEAGWCAKFQGKSSSASKLQRLDCEFRAEEFDERYKVLEEKEKIIADYYVKIDEMVQKFMSERDEQIASTESWSSCAQEIVCKGSQENNDILLDVETNVHQISDIWFTTTTNFSSILKNVNHDPCIKDTKLEMEDVKLKLAIKQAKSLSLMKSKCVIEDVRKLLQAREAIRTELENLLSLSLKCGTCGTVNNVRECLGEDTHKPTTKMGTGDSFKACIEGNTSGDSFVEEVKQIRKTQAAKAKAKKVNLSPCCLAAKKRKEKAKEKLNKAKKEELACYNVEVTQPNNIMMDDLKDIQSWAEELNKKNETIMCLNTKIFKMQQTISEQSLRNNELQVKLSECDEKIQWNQVLWKQIGKMKEQIRGLQQSNKQLEMQKKELLCRMTRLDQEIDRLMKMNEVLNKKKFLLSSQEDMHQKYDADSSKRSSTVWEKSSQEEKLIVDKHNAIDQLQTILTIMTDQKNLAQQQITLYQSKIEELECLLKNNKPS